VFWRGNMYYLKDYMETLIDEILPNMISGEKNICKCDKCLLDIKAISLNKLPGKYIVSDIVEIYRRYDELGKQLEIDAMEAILRSIDLVKMSPRHNVSIEEI